LLLTTIELTIFTFVVTPVTKIPEPILPKGMVLSVIVVLIILTLEPSCTEKAPPSVYVSLLTINKFVIDTSDAEAIKNAPPLPAAILLFIFESIISTTEFDIQKAPPCQLFATLFLIVSFSNLQ